MHALRPQTLTEALEARAAHPDAVPVAGGTDLMVALNLEHVRPPALLDLSRVDALRRVRMDEKLLSIGAGVTFATLARELIACPPLREAARAVGSPQIRNRATLGGNLATASPAGDALPVLAAWDGRVVLASHVQERRVSWREFLLGPKRTALSGDELVVGVELPRLDGAGSFAKVGTRNAMVIGVASICLQLDEADRTVRVALGSVAPTVVRAPAAESLGGEVVPWDDPEAPVPAAALAEFGRLTAAAAHPIDDVRGSAAYRLLAVEVLARRLLRRALDDRRVAAC